MPKSGEIRYCPELGGQATNAAFVWIPPGSFWMGDKREEDRWDFPTKNNPVSLITITKGFWLQQTPLTERQYSGKDSDLAQGKLPWRKIILFCQEKHLRMPTEAEWEYAARANTGHKYLRSGSNVTNNVAFAGKDVRSEPVKVKVGHLKSNSYGLFDMNGNVLEYCSDWNDARSSAPQVDPVGPMSKATGPQRAVRGGQQYSPQEEVTVSFRDSHSVSLPYDTIGVRLIWEPKDA